VIEALVLTAILGWQQDSTANAPQERPKIESNDRKEGPPPGVQGDPPIPVEEATKLESAHLSNLKQLTDLGETGEGYFSPDGKQVIFQSIRGDHPFYQIYVRDLDSKAERMISTGFGRTTCAFFHPTARKIMYASSHLDPNRDSAADEARRKAEEAKKNPRGRRTYEWAFDPYMDIFECDLDGKNLKRLTDSPGYDAEGNWSPDGSKIVFCSCRENGGKDKGNIYVMNADGGEPRRLTDTPGYDGGPFFSPDGKRILYRAEIDKPDYLQVMIMDVDGSNKRRITKNEGVNWGPYWHPDGKHVIYATSLHGHQNYELYLVDVDSMKHERVTFMPGADVLPVFDATGKTLMWTSKRGKNKDGKLSSQLWTADWKF
jgi:Tol biopolymer transport system component